MAGAHIAPHERASGNRHRTGPRPAPERQEEIAQILLNMTAADEDVYVLTPEKEASFDKALDDIEAGRVMTSDEARAAWVKLRG